MRHLAIAFTIAACVWMPASAVSSTSETAAFYERLKSVAAEGKFYYSFDAPHANAFDLDELGVCREAGRVPQLYFLEFYYVAGTRRKPEQYAKNRERLTETVKKAYARYGSVPVFSWHPENPYADRAKISSTNSSFAFPYRYRYATPGYPQEHRYVIREILDRVSYPCQWYESRLKEIASFLKGLTDAKGRPIPTVVRLFHECEDDWHWWGRESVSVADYIAFWRLTVNRLRELTGGGKNLLFLYSPDRYWNKIGESGRNNYDLLSRYAGDDYVDIIGFDDYTIGTLPSVKSVAAGTNVVEYMERRYRETVRKFRLMSEESKRRGKPCGLVETGFNNGTTNNCCTAWMLRALKEEGVRLSFVNTWSGNTVPESPKGLADWKRFVHDPAVVMADLPSDRRPVVVPAPQEMRMKSGWYVTKRSDVAKAVGKWTADATLPREGYAIFVTTEGIAVRYADEDGRFWAIETLRQLAVKTTDGLRIPCVRIRDWPRYGWRGIHLDECRHFFGKDEVKKILDLMAMHKLNVFHWHLTEDQAWRLEIPGYPDLVKYGAVRPCSQAHGSTAKKPKYDDRPYGPFFYTVDDAKEIVAYAKARHIAVVPEIELPGHARAALAAYPEFSCVGKSLAPRHPRIQWGIEDDVFCAGNDETIRFLERAFDTVCEIFPSETIHIGGDECPKTRWRACPKCQARMKAEGLKDEEALQAWMTRHFLDYLAKKGRRAIGWDEILSATIPSATRVMAWHTRQPKRVVYTAEDAVRRGHETVATPMTRCYIDARQGVEDERYEFPQRKVTLENIFTFDPAAKMTPDEAKLLLGVQACNWTERTWDKDDLEWKMWPRACALAEVGWTASSSRDYDEFVRRLEKHRARLLAADVNCAPLADRLTPETRAVFENLKAFPERGKIFYSWAFPWDWHKNERDCPLEAANGDLQKAGHVEQAVGLSPILYFEDFYKVVGTYRSEDFYRRHRKTLSEAIRKAYRQWHSIPVLGWHPENPYVPTNMCTRVHGDSSFYAWRYKSTGYPQVHRYVFKEILEGTGEVCGLGRDTHERVLDSVVKPYANPRAWFTARLNEMAEFLKTLADDDGRPIPVIVRLYHECEDDWAWWQSGSVERDDYVKLFRLTVTALRRLTDGGQNLLFLYSPDKNWQTLGNADSKDDFMYRYPGDEYVDIIGYDDYSMGEVGKELKEKHPERVGLVLSEQFHETVRKMRLVSEEAIRRGKACGLVETGIRKTTDDACNRWIMKALTAPGVRFAFANFWCYSTIPTRPAAVEDWKRFVNRPELLTVRDGIDLTKWDGRSTVRTGWSNDTRFTLAVRADLRGVKPKYWDLRKLMDLMAAVGFKRLELKLDSAEVFNEEKIKDLAKNCTHYRKMGFGVSPDPYGLTTPPPEAKAVRYVDCSGETSGLADRLHDELLKVSEEYNGFKTDSHF